LPVVTASLTAPQQARGIVEETAPPEHGGRDPQPAVERQAVTDARPQHTARERLGTGLSRALHGNATAFGYSVTITASFGAVQLDRGQPHYVDLLLYGLGAVTAFSALEGAVTKGFRGALAVGSDQVISLGTALAFVSVGLAITAAHGVASALHGPVAWFAAALVASLVFVLAESVELVLAQWVQERREEPTGDPPPR